jgi:hypothetical protein
MRHNRRYVLAGVLVAAISTLAHGQPVPPDAVEFVRAFYAKEAVRHNSRATIGEADFLAVFTAETQQAWRAAQANRNPTNVPIGPILNAFFGYGVLPGHEVKLGAVTANAGDGVSVEFTAQGEPRRITVYAVREGEAWRIADIDYGRGDSYVAYLRRLARM